MTMDTVKVGFVGCGRHASNDLYPQICRIPALELVATCDLVEDLAKKNAKVFGAGSYYVNLETMLANEELDAVMIVGPPQMHVDLGIECLKRGLHIFVEKPVALTVEDSRKLVDAAELAGKFGMVGHMMRHSPPIALAKRIMDCEQFGKPMFIESKYYTSGPREPRKFWGLDDLRWTYMLVQGLHPIDLAHYFLGDMKNVSAKLAEGKDGRLAFAIAAEFTNGGVGHLNLSSCFPGWETRLEITGDAGAFLSLENMSKLRYSEAQPWSGDFSYREPSLSKIWEVSPYDQGERIGYRDELGHFVQCIISNTRPMPDLRDAYRAMVVARSALQSVESADTVSINY